MIPEYGSVTRTRESPLGDDDDDMSATSTSSSGGSYGVRDLAADVANGPDETTGTINAELLIGQLEDGETDPADVDPNAGISGSGVQVDHDPIEDARFPTVTEVTETTQETTGQVVEDRSSTTTTESGGSGSTGESTVVGSTDPTPQINDSVVSSRSLSSGSIMAIVAGAVALAVAVTGGS